MNKIVKQQSFWQREGLIIVLSINIVVQAIIHRSNPYFLGTYFILGAIFIYLIFFRKNVKDDFISWDDSSIKIRENAQEYNYTPEEIDEVTFRNNHLRIKSGAANGILLDLKYYTPDDIELLKSFFDIQQTTTPEVSG